RGQPERYDARANLAILERFDHAVFERHFLDPAIRFNGHLVPYRSVDLFNSPSQKRQQQRQDDTQQDAGDERKIERAASLPDDDVAGQPAEGDPCHHEQADAGDDQSRNQEQLPHYYRANSTPGKKYASSNAAVSGASEPCVALFSIDEPNCFRNVPVSAFAGSVAPISVRHFLIASCASSASTTAGPDDMKAVKLGKKGRS